MNDFPRRTSLPSSSSAHASGRDVIHPTVDGRMDSDENFHQYPICQNSSEWVVVSFSQGRVISVESFGHAGRILGLTRRHQTTENVLVLRLQKGNSYYSAPTINQLLTSQTRAK
jgi:hypothetical protein